MAFAHAIRLVRCFTPVRSPESNGIAEAFVKTFKRAYARLNPRPDAAAVMAALDSWFEDYNEMHRALGMRSPPPVHQGAPSRRLTGLTGQLQLQRWPGSTPRSRPRLLAVSPSWCASS
jgi:transposase InsO family protein